MQQSIVKTGKTTTHYNIKEKDWTQFGNLHEGRTADGQNVEVTPGKSIRLFGTETNRVTPRDYDVTFAIGSCAEYDSYNKHYFGTVVAIGAKTVTIESYGRKHRLDLYRFNYRNLGDVERKHESNAAWTD